MAALFDLGSLRGKITSAYILLAAAIGILGFIALFDLWLLERQVAEGRAVAELRDAVLEMRREEKNLFLYGDDAAWRDADHRAAKSLAILRRHAESLDQIIREAGVSAMAETLEAYRRGLGAWRVPPDDDKAAVRERIQQLGHRVSGFVESLFALERNRLKSAVQESRWLILIALLIIGVSVLVLGRRLGRVALTPLKELEFRLRQISRGRFDRLEAPSGDREFITSTDAFNRMLKELEIRQRRMLQSDKLASLGILAAGVAHELNNPLSNISSSCQLLQEELDEAEPQQLRTWLGQIDSETERARRIVRSLLDFGAQGVFEKTRLRLRELIEDLRPIIGKTLRENAARLSVHVPPDLELDVDRQRMQQLFVNLIQNALHAGGEGVHLRISALRHEHSVPLLPDGAHMAGDLKCISDEPARLVEILVADDGPGIPPGLLSRVFDPFFTTSEPGHGVGLGLYIVQEIVREHEGCLAIASRPGQGTRVILLLPAGDAGDE